MRWGWRVALFVALLFALAAIFGSVLRYFVGPPETGAEAITRGLSVSVPAALVASWVMMSCVESRSLAALGLIPRRCIPEGGIGMAVGFLLIGSVLTLLVISGSLTWSWDSGATEGWPGRFLRMWLVLGFAAFLEELLFRGYAFQVVAEARGPGAAIVVSSLLFGAAHLPNPGVGYVALMNTALAGILLGIAYWRTFSIWLVTGIHLGWNGAMSLAADLPVSGLEFGSSGIRASLTGPNIWTGGSYGPEGGLALTLVTLAGIAWTVRSPRLGRSPAILALHPLPGKRLT
jgi:membrane protease YdiL (CAAX protease family)